MDDKKEIKHPWYIDTGYIDMGSVLKYSDMNFTSTYSNNTTASSLTLKDLEDAQKSLDEIDWVYAKKIFNSGIAIMENRMLEDNSVMLMVGSRMYRKLRELEKEDV